MTKSCLWCGVSPVKRLYCSKACGKKGYYSANKEKLIAASSRWIKEHPEQVRGYWRKYATSHSKQKVAYEKRRRDSDPVYRQKCLDKLQQWRSKNPDKVKETQSLAGRKGTHIRREAKKKTISPMTAKQWRKATDYFGGKCAYCGSLGDLQQDHFIAFVKGGAYSASNIVPACPTCNRTKSDADPLEWCFSTGRMVQYALAADYLGALN